MKKKASKYYVVWQGRKPGIYSTWDDCFFQVREESNAKYKSFSSYDQAQTAYKSSYHNYIGKPSTKIKIKHGIAVDGACDHVSGRAEYQAIDLESNKKILHGGPYKKGTNNLVEFLALVHTLIYCHKYHISSPIYSDSLTAISWVRDNKVRSSCPRCKENIILFQHVDQALEWLKKILYTNKILKWKTSLWGENPADFGRK